MKTRVAVVCGGRSGEHEVSLRSGEAIRQSLDKNRYEVLDYRISPEGRWWPSPILPEPGANPGVDVVFNVVHGTFGEDGTMQGLLELADLAYVGPGVLGSAASMDKEAMKRLCRAAGLPVVDYLVLYREAISVAAVLERFDLPVFVKPCNLGSSVGISKAKTEAELADALEFASRFDHKVIVERAIVGRELECAVLGNLTGAGAQASLPCEIFPSREFYDYDDKYVLGKAVVEVPAKLEPAMLAELQKLALDCFRAMECEGMARVDFLLETAGGRLYVNEINTLPGFTSISGYPKMWEASGLAFGPLLDRLIDLAIERQERKRGLRFSRVAFPSPSPS